MNNDYILTVDNLTKVYPGFKLDNVSFGVEKGKITGFIGRNGAGKSTTLKSLLNFVHPDGGSVLFEGRSFADNELEIKSSIGFVTGGVSFFPTKKLKTITSVIRSFYTDWNEDAYRKYMAEFHLDEEKTPSKLSEGMKVKYSLALALSHNASFLILDEPTSGLDPVSRDELLDIFMQLCEEKGISIFFSSHIITDLEKCADNIIYIQNGKIIDDSDIESFRSSYLAVTLERDELTEDLKKILIGCKKSKNGYCAIVKKDVPLPAGIKAEPADLETIMIHIEAESENGLEIGGVN